MVTGPTLHVPHTYLLTTRFLAVCNFHIFVQALMVGTRIFVPAFFLLSTPIFQGPNSDGSNRFCLHLIPCVQAQVHPFFPQQDLEHLVRGQFCPGNEPHSPLGAKGCGFPDILEL